MKKGELTNSGSPELLLVVEAALPTRYLQVHKPEAWRKLPPLPSKASWPWNLNTSCLQGSPQVSSLHQPVLTACLALFVHWYPYHLIYQFKILSCFPVLLGESPTQPYQAFPRMSFACLFLLTSFYYSCITSTLKCFQFLKHSLLSMPDTFSTSFDGFSFLTWLQDFKIVSGITPSQEAFPAAHSRPKFPTCSHSNECVLLPTSDSHDLTVSSLRLGLYL